jgi:amino acid adenylation domain-containing protein
MNSSVHNLLQEEVFIFPASFAQQRLWFLCQLAPESPFYNVSAAIRLRGQLNLIALEQTFREIAQRHESLRTTFAVIEEQLVQIVAPDANLPFAIIDLQSIPAHQQENSAKQIATQEAHHRFDLEKDALLRITVLKLHETEWILLLVMHHSVADGWSIGVLIRELSALYPAFCLGKPTFLPELPIQYADFAHWQREWLQGDVLDTQLSYWRQQLKDIPVLDLPTDYPRLIVQRYQGATQPIVVSQHLTNALEILSQQAGVSLFMTLLAAFQTLLYRYTGQTDIVVGSPIANRNRSELEGLIGFFVNSLVLRSDLSGNPTFWELLDQVREVTLGAYAYQDLPFEKLVHDLNQARDLSHHPLFQVAIALQNTPIQALELPGLSLEQFEFDPGTTRLDLELHFWQGSEGLKGQITYSTDLFEPTTIDRLLTHFQTLLEGIIAHPEQPLSDLPILTLTERHQLLIEWNQTDSDFDRSCIHHQFERQAELTPEAIAVVFKDKCLSYSELNQRSNQLAHYLKHLGVDSDVLVGICVERSLDMIVAVLGVLKAGGAYLPIDPSYPQERLEFMLQDSQVAILITQQPAVTRANLQVICLDRDQSLIAQQSQNHPISTTTATNLAYVIYTSGSTGQPKGALVEHHSLANLAHAQRQIFNLTSHDRVLQFASLSFDASIFEIIMAFEAGATLYLAQKESLIGTALSRFLHHNSITVATFPPTLLRELSTKDLPNLHTIISAGENCSSEIVDRWVTPTRRFFNAYGVTEAAVWSTIAEIPNRRVKSSLDNTIGRAIVNTKLYVLDHNLQPVPVGIPGELYIGGEGVARGYLNRPELTAASFISDSFSQKPGARLYKTGDVVRYRSDGTLEFLGRVDRQIKIRGYRIELNEIEAALSQHPAVREAAIIAREEMAGNRQLIAYVVFHKEHPSTPQDLRCYLHEKLPAYLVPSMFVMLESLPLTPNGKVDRKVLHDLPVRQTLLKHSPIAPRTSTETILATLWAQLFKIEAVSVEDNFFELGGDSLLAMRLMNQVSQQFDRELPVSTLFQAPTIAQLAANLDQKNSDAATSAWTPLVSLKGGSKRPFFCVHPIFGVIFPYGELAHHLDNDQPFYGLQPFGLQKEQCPYDRIEDMAAEYIKAIQTVQPQGPYLLGGWSFGGLVAFEMAQQLQQAGQQVALLAIIDTPAPIAQNQPSVYDGLKFLTTTVLTSVLPFLLDYISLLARSLIQKERFQMPKQINFKLLQDLKSWQSHFQWFTLASLIPEEAQLRMMDELTVLPMLRVFQANSRAVNSYVPNIYSGKMILFRSAELLEKAHDSTLGWGELAKDIAMYSIHGNHLSMLKQPHVRSLAKQLQTCIEESIHRCNW